jgi:hypothetical protein
VNDDMRPAYIALIRHELKVPPGSDALDALAARLTPVDATERPPARAPGIIRLRKALRTLEASACPDQSLEAFRDDLAFLSLFDNSQPVLPPDALKALLADVASHPRGPAGQSEDA